MKIKMNPKCCPILLFLALAMVSCKNENTFETYKFFKANATNKVTIDCDKSLSSALATEALLSFENDINAFYNKDKTDLKWAYSQFVRNAIYGRLKYEDFVSPHTLKVFEALKKEDLWDAENPKSHLNYQSDFFKCIADHIKDKNLSTTLNALITTHSMSPKLFGSPLLSKYRNALSDKYLASYIAFDLFYARLFDANLSPVKDGSANKQ